MARRVFYSFHFKPDSSRASLVRNMGVVEGNRPVSDNDWEDISGGGEKKIKKWIDDQLVGRSCTVVLIGSGTAGRKYINYEIIQSWIKGKGIFGVYIHNLKNLKGDQAAKGRNPFSLLKWNRGKGKPMSDTIKVYDPPHTDSKKVYAHISDRIEKWVEAAVEQRE